MYHIHAYIQKEMASRRFINTTRIAAQVVAPLQQRLGILYAAFHVAAQRMQIVLKTGTLHILSRPGGMSSDTRADIAAGNAVYCALTDMTQFTVDLDRQVVMGSHIAYKKEVACILPVTAPDIIASRMADIVWRSVISDDITIADIRHIHTTSFDPMKSGDLLLNMDISAMVPRAQCYYLYTMWDMYKDTPLRLRVLSIIAKHGCEIVLTEKPVIIPMSAIPFLQGMGPSEQRGLSILIGEYTGRPYTRAEMMQLLNV